MIVLPMPPRPPNRLVPPTTTAAIASEQVVVELVLLGAAEIGDAQHAGDAGAHGRDDHHRGDDQRTLTPEYSAASRLPPTMYT